MEVLLNIIWLLVAVGALVYWRPQNGHAASASRRDGKYLAVMALACALLLLFPVISLTDDLHAEQYPMEDSSRSAGKARSVAQAGWRAVRSPFAAPVMGAADPSARLKVVWGAVALLDAPTFCLSLVSSHQGRSPPSAL
jgi:hypothetical protein